jgi:hypothetical protein
MSTDETYADVYAQNPNPIEDHAIRFARDALAFLGNTSDANNALIRAIELVTEWGQKRPHATIMRAEQPHPHSSTDEGPLSLIPKGS